MESVEAFEIYPDNVDEGKQAEIQAEVAEERGKTVEDAKEHILRICRTALEMLQDRGFTCESYEKPKIAHSIDDDDDENDNEKELDADKIFPGGFNTRQCITLYGTKDKKICVRIYQVPMSMKDLTEDIDSFIKGLSNNGDEERLVENSGFYNPIVVVPSIQKLASKSLQQRNIQWFTHEELLVNITHHMLVPKFHVLSDAEKKEFLECYKLKIGQLPKMLDTDPISRYYGLKKGDVVKITRKSVTAGSINDNAGLVTNAEVYDAIKRNNAELKGSRRPFSAQEKDESVFLKAVEGYIKRHTNPTILKDRKKAEEYAKYLLDEGLSGIEIVQFSNFQPLEIVDVHIVVEECQSRLPDDKPAEIIEHLKKF